MRIKEIARGDAVIILSLPRTSYVLWRLMLQAFSDSLPSCRPSSSLLHSVRFVVPPGNHRAPPPAGRRPSVTFQAFSDSLQACRPLSCRCSTRSDFSSSRAPHCTWKSSHSDTNWPSSIDRGARVFASRRPIESCGRGSRMLGAAGAQPFISSNRRQSSRGIAAVLPVLDLEKPTPHRAPRRTV
jgi:hypothetical protein